MTRREFLEKLRATSRYRDWAVNYGGKIRDVAGRCPLAAVAGTPGDGDSQAAVALGIYGKNLQFDIVAASDMMDGIRRYDPKLRIQLLKACRLL